jgi:hypothetical protein
VELDLSLLPDDQAGAAAVRPDALAEGGYLDTLLTESSRFATGLARRLRDRIHDRVINRLAVAVASRSDITGKTREEQCTALDG